MSPQESQLLQTFLNQLVQVRGVAKDPQADALIAAAVAQQPDAAYLLVQRALLLDQAVNSAKEQITALQAQLQAQAAPASSSGFLDASNAWGNSAAAAPMPASAPAQANPTMAGGYAARPVVAPAPAAAPAPGFLGGGAGSMLGTVAATAAGVAGGAFLFRGIENMMGHNNGGASLLGQQAGLGSVGKPAENSSDNFFGNEPAAEKTASSDAPELLSDDIADSGGSDFGGDTGGDDSSA